MAKEPPVSPDTAMTPDEFSPMMRQYLQLKEQCGDAILLFRCGDFYEMFMEDAVRGAEALDIALTKRGSGNNKSVPLAGIPYHSAQSYIYRLTRQGFRVAICEQMEVPQKGKKLVRRELVRTISPGTIIDSEVIEAKENNYLCALYDGGLGGVALASVDVTTGEFRATWEMGAEGWKSILSELGTLAPSEILLDAASAADDHLCKLLQGHSEALITPVPAEAFSPQRFGAFQLACVPEGDLKAGESEKEWTSAAAGAILHYLEENQREALSYIEQLTLYQRSRYLVIDRNTERNLELVTSTSEGSRKHSLLGVLDHTVTSMGGRLFKQWVLRPLLDVGAIVRRQDVLQTLVDQPNLRGQIREVLRGIHDLERVLGRVTFGNANARDLAALRDTMRQVPAINSLLDEAQATAVLRRALQEHEERDETAVLSPTGELLDPVREVTELLLAALVEDPPLTVREGGMIRDGYEQELDDLRTLRSDGRGAIARMQERERERTGIPSLKVAYNKVFGYYIEVTHAHKDKTPDDYIRKQTLTNAERYITPELKEFEANVLNAEERMRELEYQLLNQLLEVVRGYGARLRAVARMIARLDALQGMAEAASRFSYVRPLIHEGPEVEISEGRHPVLEQARVVDQFVPNDCRLDSNQQIYLITGPNMAGKSTYIRQVALIVLMAQMGGFVPASAARVGIVDRLFSRVGASDDLARGRSTFMVEMSEAAHILRNATPRSLVILDEIGRGTSTYDGVSLAWAICEYLHGIRGKGVKALFATHYHELASLESLLSRVVNFHVQVSERDGRISFLYRIARGYTDHSYGIHVADLAGVPKRVTDRARKILRRLEQGEHLGGATQAEQDEPYQISLFQMMDEPLRARLADIDVNMLTPMEALHLLEELVREARGDG